MSYAPSPHRTRRLPALLSACLALALAACGGGGGGGSDNSNNNGETTQVTLTGVVAVVTAASGVEVTTKCASGNTGTATTNASGTYAMTLTGAVSLPCVMEAATTSGTLHSVTADAGTTTVTTTGATTRTTTVKANITPVTELVVARATGFDPSTFWGVFGPSKASLIAAAKVSAAITAVTTQLSNAGINVGSANVISGDLTPVSDPSGGNTYGQALASLSTTLTNSGTTLTQLVASTASGSSNATTTSTNPSLPADLLLKPAAANCASLRSGVYRVVRPHYSSLTEVTSRLSIDAQTLQVTDLGDSTVETWLPNGDCRFIAGASSANKVDVVVTAAGVLVGRPYDSGVSQYSVAVGFPEQTHTLDELVGDWNAIGRELVSGNSASTATFGGMNATATVGSNGVLSNIYTCEPGTGCGAISGVTITLAGNATGFSMTGTSTTDNWIDQVYVYKAGGGELMMVNTSGDGSIAFWTKKGATSAPTVSSVSSSWGVGSDIHNVAPAFSESDWTNTSASASSWTRQSNIDGHSETVTLNSPRTGFNFRAAGTATNNAGATVNVSEFTALGLRGMGMSALWMPTFNSVGGLYLSPNKPANNGAVLPTGLLGRANAPTCAALRTATYRIVQPWQGSGNTLTASFDASTMQVSYSIGGSDTWVPVTGEACHFKDAATGNSDWTVSPAGVVVGRMYDSGSASYHLTLGFPEQTHTLAELAGTWNVVGLEANSTGSAYHGATATWTLSGTGTFSAVQWCDYETSLSTPTCQSVTTGLPTLSVNAGGGFDVTGGGRAFAYKTRSGWMILKVDPDGSVQIQTPQTSLSGGTGSVNAYWNLSSTINMVSAAAIANTSYRNTGWDATTGTLTRVSLDDGHTEQLLFNQPRTGYITRAAGTATTSSNTPVVVRAFTGLNLRQSMGLSALWMPMDEANNVSTARLLVSVSRY